MESVPQEPAAAAAVVDPVADSGNDNDEDQTSLGPGVQVWVPHPTEGFQTGVVVEEQSGGKAGAGQSFLVRTDEDDKEEVLSADTSIWLRNPAILEGVDDLTKLSYMHEAAILHNLHVRYMISQIYTYTGPILIAVNPYQRLPLYSKQMISQYCGQPLGKLSPHVYAIAEDAFRSMLTERRSQSILVSGESGAGKTETTKFLLQYFAAMGEENKGEGNVHNQVLQSTPLLEAFGNAKTLRNDNSSRFGKFIEIQFDRSGNISGASIHTYLLEKSRIVRQQLGERGYHVFYQLLAGLTDDERKDLRLGSASEFHYVNQSDCTEIEGVSDSDTFQKTRKAMTVVGISDERQLEIFKLLAAVLHLGNWKKSGSDEPIQIAATLLQCDFELMKKSLLQRKMVAGREVYFVDMDEEQAEGARDSLAMLLYSRMFDWLVVALNENIEKNKKASTLKAGEEEVFIGVLDIYGFESFDVNSFEQFCINYANEKLQQQFNQHIFKHEQQEYVKEKLDWSYINFNDNQECLDLIEQKPLGILSLLDEECRFPKASATTFALKLKQNHTKNKYFSSDRFAESSFTVSHYAGRVTYDTATFLDKNKDYIIEDQVKVMLESKSEFVREVFKTKTQAAAPPGPASGRPGGRDGGGSSSFKFVSVAAQFRDSLSSLMNTIGKTTPHYVRCIKPNPQKKPALFDKPQVLHQLRCGGVLESVRISMAGYPGRHSYDQFYKRYRVLAPSAGRDAASPQDSCKDLVAALSLNKRHYQFGVTKLFLKGGQIAVLERRRGEKLSEAALKIQKTWRGYKDFRRYRNILRAVVRLQTFARSVVAKGKLRGLRENAAATKIQTTARRFIARARYLKQRKALVYVQRVFTAKREKRALRAERREKASVTIQTLMRGFLKRKEYQKYRHTVIAAQNLWRQKVAKRELAELKTEARQLSTVVAAKAALENKMQELEWRLSAENKMKKKAEKENAKLREELEELRKAMREVKLADERREKEEEERRARKEKEGREQVRNHGKELEELRAKLAEEAERSAALARELAALKEASERDRERATASQQESEEAKNLREENEHMKDLIRQMEEKMEVDEEDYEAKIHELHRELEKLRIQRSPLIKADGQKMETLQKRISDFTSIKTFSQEGVPTRLASSGGGSSGSPHHRAVSPHSLSHASLPYADPRRLASSGDDDLHGTPTSHKPLGRINSDLDRDRRRRRSLTSSAAPPTSQRQLSFETDAVTTSSSAQHRPQPDAVPAEVARAAAVDVSQEVKVRSAKPAAASETAASETKAAVAVPSRADKKKDEREAFMKRIEQDIEVEKDKAREIEERRKRKEEQIKKLQQEIAAEEEAHPRRPRPTEQQQRKASTDNVKVTTVRASSKQADAATAVQPQPAAMMATRQHSRDDSDKAKKRREIERDLIEKLQKKYRDQEFSLVGLENEAIMTLLPDPRDPMSQQMVRFLLAELEPGFVSGVPAPALIIYSLFTHWRLLARPEAKAHKSKADVVRGRNEIMALIIEELYHTVRKNSGEIELIIYWLSNVCTLFHLVSEKLAQLKTANKAEKRRKGAEQDDDQSDSESDSADQESEEEEEEEELYTVSSFDDFDESHEFAVSPERIRRNTTTPVAFKRQLSELVTKLYALLLKRAYAELTDTLHESVLGKSLSSPRNLAGSPQRAMNTIQPVKEVLSKYLLGLVQNFVFLSLVQKFFAQVFYFINATLFNEILLVRQLCTVDKAVDIKMHLANLESWIIEEGGLWLENAKVQLEPLHEIITLLMMPKKLIVSSEELRNEVIPRLNSLQIKQVLAMYTPTEEHWRALDMEERLTMADIQKMDKGKPKDVDESLLLETAQVFALSSKELHYLELNDANNIPFPFEIKQKVHELVEEDILKRMSMAKEVIKQSKGAGVLRTLVEADDHGDERDESDDHADADDSEGEPRRSGSAGGSRDNISPRGADDSQKKSTHFWSSFFSKDTGGH